MPREFRIFGPPGTGKTHRLATRDIPRAVAKYGKSSVLVASFTRAAAREIASRGLEVDDRLVGTLHSICYHAFGCPELVIKKIKDWNAEYPSLALSGSSVSGVDEMVDGDLIAKAEGDALYQDVQRLRAKLVPEEQWLPRLRKFNRLWNDFKFRTGTVDFTDLIDMAIAELPYAPGNPAVMFLDEAQDFTPQQLKLVRRWGQETDWFVLVGDDDQLAYSFLGATPEAFLTPPVPDEMKTVLQQSFRVPSRVLEVSTEMIRRVRMREPKEYFPRIGEDFEYAEGSVVWPHQHCKDPEATVELAKSHIAEGRTVMFLASCAYMLNPVKAVLRKQGLPFHNPYRRQRGDWNPLNRRSDAVSASELLLSFVSDQLEDPPYWTIAQLLTWAKYVKVGSAGLIRKKGREALFALENAVSAKAEGLHTSREVLHHILSPEAIEPALNRDLGWLAENLKAERQRTIEYPMTVLRMHGAKALSDKPQIILGTVHSVKGGESDAVFLYPDVSQAGCNEMQVPAGLDAIHRLFYIGMTRARDTLYLMDGSPGSACIQWGREDRFSWRKRA